MSSINMMDRPMVDPIGTNTAAENEAGEPGQYLVFVRVMRNGYIKPYGGGQWITAHSERGAQRMLGRMKEAHLIGAGPIRLIELPGVAEWHSFKNSSNGMSFSCWCIPMDWFDKNQARLLECPEAKSLTGWRLV